MKRSERLQRMLDESIKRQAELAAYLNSPEVVAHRTAVLDAFNAGEAAITCGDCKHTAKWSDFETEQDRFKCPRCAGAWRITHDLATLLESGFVMPGRNHIERITNEISN